MNSGVLYLIATPIGNLGDITHRALELLASVDCIVVEDSRHSAILLNHYQISTKKMVMHAHNEENQCENIIKKLKNGESIAVISDAGTPLISDPGFALVRSAHENSIQVTPIPGPCAAIAALSASGLPADRFVFEGFLPSKNGARRHAMQELVTENRTMIFYEAPHRILAMVADVIEVFGADRQMVIARELTKKFETIRLGPAAEILDWLTADTNQQKGEFVVLVHGAPKMEFNEALAQKVLGLLLEHMSVKQAAIVAAEITGLSKNKLYDLATKVRQSER